MEAQLQFVHHCQDVPRIVPMYKLATQALWVMPILGNEVISAFPGPALI